MAQNLQIHPPAGLFDEPFVTKIPIFSSSHRPNSKAVLYFLWAASIGAILVVCPLQWGSHLLILVDLLPARVHSTVVLQGSILVKGRLRRELR